MEGLVIDSVAAKWGSFWKLIQSLYCSFWIMLLNEFIAKLYQNQFITTVLKISSERFSIYYSVAFCSELFGRFVHRFSSSKVRSFLEINTLTLLFFWTMFYMNWRKAIGTLTDITQINSDIIIFINIARTLKSIYIWISKSIIAPCLHNLDSEFFHFKLKSVVTAILT